MELLFGFPQGEVAARDQEVVVPAVYEECGLGAGGGVGGAVEEVALAVGFFAYVVARVNRLAIKLGCLTRDMSIRDEGETWH